MFERVLDVADVRCAAVRLKIIIGNAGFEARTPTQTHAMLVPTDDLGWQLVVLGANICRLDY